MQMPMSANAKLNTRKLLGVLSCLTLKKATTVTAFKRNPSRPFGGTEIKIMNEGRINRSPVRTIHDEV